MAQVGRLLVTGADDGDVRFYVLSLDKSVDIAESRLTRSLTEAGCQEYLHMDAYRLKRCRLFDVIVCL
jgi:hypothetical protein